MIKTLETDRMILRPFELTDAPDMYLLGSMTQIIQYVGNAPFKHLTDAENYLKAHPLNDYRETGFGRLACIDKQSNQLIGFCGLKYMDEIDEIEIGYRFLPAFWGKGLASEAVKTVLDWALEEKHCTRLVGCIHPDNEASKKVLSKFGFKKEKTVNVAFITDVPVDLFVYEVGD
ncbi:GNAT family N-acetyltransferase [Pseudoalteromonas rubra]|uniref:GNAT family N-acetyltransferase n=1 Tax=Pseudoalteromonas rubra TaxID=43658 RepID=UPI000F7715F9|nr:GNAT family N-acetyltransferase [Pseudoalteromonas rubra]